MTEPGYVYFVQARTLRLIKIGYAVNLDARLSSIRCHSPDPIDLLGLIESDLPKATEAELHLRFAEQKRHGEWFEPSADLLAFIAEHTVKRADDMPTYEQLLAVQQRFSGMVLRAAAG